MFMLVIALLVSCVAYVNGDDGFATADNRRRILASTPASNAWQRAQRAFKQFGASEHTLAVFQQRSEVWTIHGLWLNSDIGDGNDAGAKKHQRGKPCYKIVAAQKYSFLHTLLYQMLFSLE
eukprot:GEMP01152709.1.p1 GENE.GEMP01152709.1~~GEMP01152709.1.p1  ORF type:complete len:121 (+),score=13.30 GEMP01152709.1:25-387(+)